MGEAASGAAKRSVFAIYDLGVQAFMTAFRDAIVEVLPDLEREFFGNLCAVATSAIDPDPLSTREIDDLKRRYAEHLLDVCRSDLTEDDHKRSAIRQGLDNALIGWSRDELVRSSGVFLSTLRKFVDFKRHSDAIAIYALRLNRDLAWQTEVYLDLQRKRQGILKQITRAAWDANNYSELISFVVNALVKYDGTAGCTVLRPDEAGIFQVEAIAGDGTKRYISLLSDASCQIAADANRDTGDGPAGRAWCFGRVERSVDIAADPRMAPWASSAARVGFKSSVAIPLKGPRDVPVAILALYSAYPGGFSSPEQSSFISLIEVILGFAIARLERAEGKTSTIAYQDRLRWASALSSNAVVMVYQPVLDVRSGKITKVEALARLADGDRLLSPGVFLPAFSADQIFALYRIALREAVRQRAAWGHAGLDLEVSVNLAPAALSDERYTRESSVAASQSPEICAGITLELLEREDFDGGDASLDALLAYKRMGFKLAQDDLGSAYSGLQRLKDGPYDYVKIDRSLLFPSDSDRAELLKCLRFAKTLIELCHVLGKEVIFEGVEDAGTLEALAGLGVDYCQGFAIARPLAADAIAGFCADFVWQFEPGHPLSVLGELAGTL